VCPADSRGATRSARGRLRLYCQGSLVENEAKPMPPRNPKNKSSASGPGPVPTKAKWQAPRRAAHYAGARFGTPRAEQRDSRAIARLLRRHGEFPIKDLLDAPCGTGRLAPALSQAAKRYIGADISAAMLGEFRGPNGMRALRINGDATELPFQGGSFDVVVCCRLLHHLDPGAPLEAVARELVRVSRSLVLASFWDCACLPGLRRAWGWRRDTSGRRPLPRATIEEAFAGAGGRLLGYTTSCRFLSMQTFIAVGVD